MKTVTVLMSTFNGEKFIKEQIESLICQINVDLKIFVRDDGSTDSTIEILKHYESKGVLSWYTGKNLKPALSFIDLIFHAPESDYYAFCDQDDVWKKDKLYKAITSMDNYSKKNIPLLYCSNYQLVDSNLNELPDNGHVSTTTFGASLASSCCTGCTTVFNKKLIKILQIEKPNFIVMHDDWAHKVCLAVGGEVIFDKEKTLYYRQHGNNADGGVHSLKHKLNGILRRMRTKENIRSKQLSEINRIFYGVMPKNNIKMIDKIIKSQKSFVLRLNIIFDSDIRTEYYKLNRGFWIAIILGYY